MIITDMCRQWHGDPTVQTKKQKKYFDTTPCHVLVAPTIANNCANTDYQE